MAEGFQQIDVNGEMVEFPSSMSDGEIVAAIEGLSTPQPPPQLSEMTGFRASDGMPEPSLRGFGRAVVGAGEGLVDLVGKGLGGLAGGIAALPVAFEPEAPALIEKVSSAVSSPFEPRTREGQLSAGAMQFPFEMAERGADRLGEMAPGGPGVQTAVKTGILGLPGLINPSRNVGRSLSAGESLSILPERAPLTIKQQVLKEAQEVGYAVPSSDAVPGLGRGTVEGLMGKPRLAQDAAYKNQQITNNLAAKELGLPDGVEISLSSLDNIRATAGEAYKVLQNAGTITAPITYRRALSDATRELKAATKDFDVLKTQAVNEVLSMARGFNKSTFQASSVIEATKILRDEASSAYRNGQSKVGDVYRDISKALEDAAEAHLSKFGDPNAVQAFRDARVLIAKSYSVEKALKGDGIVSAPALAAQRSKRDPLTGGLDMAARFAEQYPKSAAVPKGAPISTGRFSGLVGGGGASLLAGSGQSLAALGMLGLTFGGPLVRAGILSKPGQAFLANPRGSIQNMGNTGLGLLESAVLANQAAAGGAIE